MIILQDSGVFFLDWYPPDVGELHRTGLTYSVLFNHSAVLQIMFMFLIDMS